ncbi:MAG TPA: hypothetical protein VKV18_11610 [Chthonomonas sp.]|uniref:hypothetical protein n=1 Tax=Chthonomonas sp. TaxID=2282153 RepID=UPI002B4B726A|nr:hypothetical protein [Chthonomonas sp.]HLI49319.1 hypothetical protein [Chthonomonas sp.]
MQRAFTLIFGLLLIGLGLESRAERDIVYAARYYFPPHSHRLSHFHIYRINPDGSGRIQLTYGSTDDTGPLWSPNGRLIAFDREYERHDAYANAVYVMDARGHHLKRIAKITSFGFLTFSWTEDSRALIVNGKLYPLSGQQHTLTPWEKNPNAVVSPNRRYLYVSADPDSGKPDVLINLTTQQQIRVETHLDCPVWWNNRTIVGACDYIDDSGQTVPGICTVGLDGKIARRLRFQPSQMTPEGAYTSLQDIRVARLQKIPQDKSHLVLWSDEGNSTVRPLYGFYYVDIDTGKAKPITDGQFLLWSPDGTKVMWADRDLVPYGKHRDGTERVVWGTPLWMMDIRTGHKRSLTPGIVWVDSAEWRGGGN